jgi:triphosphoribosyl-dephospho-CoA synthase
MMAPRDPSTGAGALASTSTPPMRHRAQRAFFGDVARLAVGCLHAELTLQPKPGLVSPLDNGSHNDMTPATFMRSLFALRHFFGDICRAGHDDAQFAELKRIAIAAERRMLRATGGINTHRGAIFSLGLLCAAAGRARAQGIALSAPALRATLLINWGADLADHTRAPGADSHGLQAAARHAAGGAREEGALGLPSVFDVALPALLATLRAGRGMRLARIDALFALMAHISDTNVFHRGGADGAQTVKTEAARFLARGGTADPGWLAAAMDSHRVFVARRLSPGGAADLLAAACLVHAIACYAVPAASPAWLMP